MPEETLYDRRNRYTHLDTVSSTLISGDTIFLVKVIVNSDATGCLVTLTESGNAITILSADATTSQGTYKYGLSLDNLTVAITTSSLIPDITVIYR